MKTQCSLVIVIVLMVSCVAWAVDPPDISAISHSNITSSSVHVKAHLIDDGGEACDVRYWAQPSAGGATIYTAWRPGLHSGAYPEGDITGLSPNTYYDWGVQARNSAGTTGRYGGSFTTLVAPPDISAKDRSNITSSSVHAKAQLIDDGGEACDVRYWAQPSAGGTMTYTAWRTGLVSGAWPEADITGLNPNTPYNWGVEAKNSAGTDTDSGSSFTTLTALPTITQQGRSNITSSSAHVKAHLIDDGGEACEVRFYYMQPGDTAEYTSWRSGLVSGAWPEADITGLDRGTTYYWGVIARNSAGVGSDVGSSFTTLVDTPVIWVWVESHSNITTNSVHVESHLADDGGEACDVRFWAQPCAGGAMTYTAWISGAVSGQYPEADITGLTPNTPYNWGVEARNSAGTCTDPGCSFTTLITALPDISAESCSNITTNSVHVKSHLIDDGGEACDIRYWAQPSAGGAKTYTAWSPSVVSGGWPEADITGLDPDTQYNWGVEARNSAGTVEDSGYSFTTLALEDETVLLYVDDNGPSDPGPSDPNLSDPQEDGSSDHPFDSIQEAIDATRDGQIVAVLPGTYRECLNLQGKNILLTSLYDDPNALGAIGQTVIDGHQTGPVVTFASGEDANCILSGFTITGGKAESGGAILCYDSSPTVSHCVIVGNCATHYNGGGIDCYQSAARFINCTVSDNYAQHGGGIHCEDSNAVFCNSIIWDNTPDQILVSSGAAPDVQYCNVQGGFSRAGNRDTNPYFCIPGYWADPCDLGTPVSPDTADALWVGGDYHLQSQAGRYDAHNDMWIQDTQHSPCIDSGDPNSDCSTEPAPNGACINMGAYGGTAEASQSAVGKTVFLEFSLDTDPGWTTTGDWSFGLPLGAGGTYGNPDPNSGYTGINVYGVNLAGDYRVALGNPYYVTAGPLDCSTYQEVSLQFARWLNSDFYPYVGNMVEVSSDGQTWQTVWQAQEGENLNDSQWQVLTYDISDTANGQSTVYVRWGYEINSDRAYAQSGWNIDDVQLSGVTAE